MCFGIPHSSPLEEPSVRPHIIVLLADDLIPTPNIDALAATGVILQRHYSASTCTPSRTALLASVYPARTNVGYQAFPPASKRSLSLSVQLLPQWLKRLGYTTHMVGKWHLGYSSLEYTPTWRGFDTFFGYYNGASYYFNHTLFWPLFLYLSYQGVHSSCDGCTAEAPRRNVEKFSYIKARNRTVLAGAVDALDESVGRLLEALQSRGMLANSVVLLASDNGAGPLATSNDELPNAGNNWPLRGGQGGRLGRRDQDAGGAVVRQPPRYSTAAALPAGGDVSDLGMVDGRNFWTSLTTGEGEGRKEVLLELEGQRQTSALISGRYKVVKRPGGPNDELQDLRVAPPEGEPSDDLDLDELMKSSAAWKALQAALGVSNSTSTSTSLRPNWRAEATRSLRRRQRIDRSLEQLRFVRQRVRVRRRQRPVRDSEPGVVQTRDVNQTEKHANANGRPSLKSVSFLTVNVIFWVTLVAIIIGFLFLVTYCDSASDSSDNSDKHQRGPKKVNTPPTPATPPTPEIPPTPETPPTSSDPVLFCVLGHRLTVMVQTWNFYCNYIVYPDVVAVSSDAFAAPDGVYSWNEFFRVAKSMPDFYRGLAFSAHYAENSNSTVGRIPSMKKALDDMVAKGVVAMGTLNFTSDATSGIASSLFKSMFQVLSETVRGKPGALTFLGVRLNSLEDAKNFAADVQNINGLDCVVLQTHLSDAMTVAEACVAQLVTYKSSWTPVPSFDNAMQVQSILNSSQSGLRLMFSSTLAVMDYAGASGQSSPTKPGQKCEYSAALDVDVICNVTSPTSFIPDQIDVAEKAKYNVGVVAHFASFETMDSYLNFSSGGWAVFDIERDVKATCFHPDPQHRLGLMATKIKKFNEDRKAAKKKKQP
ncbi:hypothetical protein MTO96_008896 [Rhipicephalus appendiculatus]